MLEELRKKPRSVRTLYAFWGAIFVTGLISFFWIMSVMIRLNDVETKPLEDMGAASGAFSQFLEKAKEKFFSKESTTTQDSDTTSPAPFSTSSPSVSTSTPTRSNTVPLIATSTSPKVQIGTSSEVAN